MTTEKTADVTIVAEPGSGGDVKFSMISKFKKDGKLSFKSPANEVYLMTFELDDRRVGLSFVDDRQQVFWTKEGDCPRQESHEGPFNVVSVTKNKLQVLNANTSVADYHFSLQFVRDGGQQVSYDPIIENKNGSQAVDDPTFGGEQSFSAAQLLIGSVAIIGILALGYVLLT